MRRAHGRQIKARGLPRRIHMGGLAHALTFRVSRATRRADTSSGTDPAPQSADCAAAAGWHLRLAMWRPAPLSTLIASQRRFFLVHAGTWSGSVLELKFQMLFASCRLSVLLLKNSSSLVFRGRF